MPEDRAALPRRSMRPARADDYAEPLAGMIRRGEIEAPDEFVIEDDVAKEEASLRRLSQAHAAFLDAVMARARAERAEADLRVVYEAEEQRHELAFGEAE